MTGRETQLGNQRKAAPALTPPRRIPAEPLALQDWAEGESTAR